MMHTPENPSFTTLKWGFRGSKLYRHVFVMKNVLPVGEKVFFYINGDDHKRTKISKKKKQKQNKTKTNRQKKNIFT